MAPRSLSYLGTSALNKRIIRPCFPRLGNSEDSIHCGLKCRLENWIYVILYVILIPSKPLAWNLMFYTIVL